MKILEILGNIGFDWRIAFANFVNFLIIFYLLKRYAFGPIGRILDERRRKIEEGLEHAREAETDLMMAKEERARSVEKGKEEMNEILAHARMQEDTILTEAAENAKKEASQIIERAEITAAARQGEMEQEVRVRAADLIVEGVSRVLREEIDAGRSERIIRDILPKT